MGYNPPIQPGTKSRLPSTPRKCDPLSIPRLLFFGPTSVGYDERTWIDHFGDPHSDEMRLQERYRRVDRDTLELTLTLTDPAAGKTGK